MKPQTIQVDIPLEIVMLCDLFDITPGELLKTFMGDLASMKQNQGSDERDFAKRWFLRGAISWPDWIQDYEDAQQVVESFNSMYDENYPSICNTDYDIDRKAQLTACYKQAKERKEFLKKVKSI